MVLALRCIVKDHRHRNLHHFVRRPSVGLARQQAADGGFGGQERATSLALQALHDAPALSDYWNRSAALGWLLARQAPDGSFGGGGGGAPGAGAGAVRRTAEALLAIGRGHLGTVRDLPCSHPYPDQPIENHGTYWYRRL